MALVRAVDGVCVPGAKPGRQEHRSAGQGEALSTDERSRAKRFEESLSNNQISFDLLEYYYEEGAWYAYYFGMEFDELDIERRIVRTLSFRVLTSNTDMLRERSW